MDCAIRTRDLTRSFGQVTAVDRIAIDVPQGSIYGFLGPNGAGKSTTIRLLLRLIRPDRGEIRVLGFSLSDRRQLLLRKVGALVEMPSLYPHLTGWENLDVTRRLLQVDRSKIPEVLNVVGLQEDAKRLVRGYSLGMRQRLGLALALLGDPELLILDEPTNGLDPNGILEMRRLIRHLAQDLGVTIFVSSHLLAEVEQIATHVGIVLGGRLVHQGSLDALLAQSSPHVAITTSDQSRARAVLEKEGFVVSYGNGGELCVRSNDSVDSAAITRLLVSSGIDVEQIVRVTPSLEDLFFGLVAEGKDVR